MKKLLFAPGFACTSEIWSQAKVFLKNAELLLLEWHPNLHTVDVTRDYLREYILKHSPDVYIGHSLGGLLLLELLIAESIPNQPTLIVDAFLLDPDDLFKNFVWEDEKLREQVTTLLDQQRPLYQPLRNAIQSWTRENWPLAAIETGAHFVYGGRGATNEDVYHALGWPLDTITKERLTIFPNTSHFLMMEQPAAFYQLVQKMS